MKYHSVAAFFYFKDKEERMNNKYKSKLTHLWDQIKADAKMDNATKAKIVEETVQDMKAGLQKMTDPQEFFRKK